jgi:hypothetical protein
VQPEDDTSLSYTAIIVVLRMTRFNIITNNVTFMITMLLVLIMNLLGFILVIHTTDRSTRLIERPLNMAMTPPGGVNASNFGGDKSEGGPEGNGPGDTD